MSLYIRREASKLWKRICAEISTEIKLLAENWKYLLAGLIFQYIHGVAARAVHYFHRPGPLLQDFGFFLLPELGLENAYISETLFNSVFLLFVLWTFHPFILKSKRIYTVLLWCRVLAFLGACQFLRIITFYSTQLPGPNYHCREGSKLAILPPPKSVLEVFIVNFPRGVLYGCGDLIFSSHTIFTLVFVRTYQKYGTKRVLYNSNDTRYSIFRIRSSHLSLCARIRNTAQRGFYTILMTLGTRFFAYDLHTCLCAHVSEIRHTEVFVSSYEWIGINIRLIKQCGWLIAVIQSLLIVASRKHYTVDIIVAWYTVNLVVTVIDYKLPELPDRTGAAFLLPMSKDGRTKEENLKLLNGNSGDSVDRRMRTPVNGMILEDASSVHVNTVMNGM